MLAVNGVPYTNLEKDDKLGLSIKKALTAIKKQKTWVIKFHESQIKKPKPGEPNLYEASAGILIKSTQRYPFDGMEHDITYYTGSSTDNNGKVKYNPNFVDYGGTMVLDSKTQADLIFFLTCATGLCDSAVNLQDYQRKPKGRIIFAVENILVETINKNAVDRKITKVKTLILDEDYGLKESVLRELAISYGIPNAETDHKEMLVHALLNYVLVQTDGKYNMDRINEFINDVKDTSLAKLRAAVKMAISKKYIVLVEGSTGRKSWYDVNEKGEKNRLIATVPKNGDPEDSLIKHYASKPDDRASFEKYVKEQKGTGPLKKAGTRPHKIEVID